MADLVHYMPRRRSGGISDESKTLCGKSTSPPENPKLNGAETYGARFAFDLNAVTCPACRKKKGLW